MCATCGCSDEAGVRVIDPESHGHGHGHDDGHHHLPPEPTRTVLLERDLLAANDLLAEGNRGWLAERRIHAVNLMSSPGSGKTTLLERTIRDQGGRFPMSVVEGDQETVFDAHRIKATGCRVIQVNTGAGCHLDADMLAKALRALDPPVRSTVFIENVGNLVCPALFDLGEGTRAVIMSVTEGADKPLKYPHMFRTADVVLLNKIDLLPYVDFDIDAFLAALTQVNPRSRVLKMSATAGEGLEAWYGWLREHAGS
ncbi:hydrogenase nickel incorporation protein HypB [Amycolatopsis orientalis]|uniref:hydrogenase nickel incorporation protein HypB n=1 Tax=Amycolatopsis orientalis TaxID=31958 RepID=UPI0004276389|nr:hydrogenase nickel incorporation protein HypB [Amycolatopsis orientalis]